MADQNRTRQPRDRSNESRRAQPPSRYEQPSGDGLRYREPLSMAEVEERIVRADDELAELTAIHMGLADDAAKAEAAWKRHRDTVIVRISSKEDRTAADVREAKARCETDPVTGKVGSTLYEDYKVTEAASESSARAMRSLEARLSAFQTIASNLRNRG